MAALVQETVEYSYSFIEIPWGERKTLACLIKYSKDSLLHYYICNTIAVHYRQEYSKEHDWIEKVEDVDHIEEGFETYQIIHQPFAEYVREQGLPVEDPNLGEHFYDWFCTQRDAFDKLWERITEEVFHLLFGDRQFLLSFNQSLAEYLQSGEVKIPDSYVTKHGYLKRCKRFPEWVKRAVFFRDGGKCVFCHSDLSGLLNTDFKRHLDHIVPLYLWGTNDPCNVQLTCERCNLKKSKLPAITSPKYTPYWDY